jgi:lipoprotein-anchoring transpeptidase ErfK/SrfK
MRQRSFIILAAALAFLLVGSVAVYAYDSSHDDQIADGVKAGGVDIGGMRTTAARIKLQRVLGARLSRPLDVVYHDRRFRLDSRTAQLKIDVNATVDEALRKSRDGNVIGRTFRGVFGGSVNADVPVEASYSHSAVAHFVKHIQRGIDQPARDASVSMATGTLHAVKARKGLRVHATTLRRAVEVALSLPNGDRRVRVAVTAIKPHVTTKQLATKYGTVIAINRSAFHLTLYKHLKQVRTYPIAVGRQGLETPAGEYTVNDKQINPSWHVPNSSWAGSLAGRVIPPGPQDPLKARWIGIINGAGIHGTADVGSLGTAGSHGCIRMAIPDVIQLYGETPYGSKIFIQ